MKKIIYLVAAFLCMACSDDNESNQQNGGASGGVTEVPVAQLNHRINYLKIFVYFRDN